MKNTKKIKRGGGLTAGPHWTVGAGPAAPAPLLRAQGGARWLGSPRRRSPPAGLTGGAAAAEPRPQAARGQGGRRRMGRRRGGLRGGSRRRMATGSGGGCVPAAARPTGGKAGRGEHQGGQAVAGRAALASGRAQGGPAAHAGGGRRVPRRRDFDSTAVASIQVGNRSGARANRGGAHRGSI